MTSPSFRDMENLSAYLDGQISHSQRTRLEIRIQSDAVLAAALEELRQTRGLLRRTPQRRAPRNFTLTARMAGIRPPVPRLVPALSWASAVAMLLFIFTLGTSLIGQLSFGAAAPMLAAAPSGIGGGPPAAATQAPAMAAPATPAPEMAAKATMAPATTAPAAQGTTDQTALATPTAEAFVMTAPEATPPGTARIIQPPIAPKARSKPLNPWLFIWPGVGVLLGTLALLVRWLSKRAFQRKNPRG
jgi:anti-sigma factor RsiW